MIRGILAALIVGLFCCQTVKAVTYEYATITVTNTAGVTNGQTLTVNSSVRTWTNAVYVPSSQILTNATAAGAAANLMAHLGITPFSGLQMSAFTSTSVTLRSGDGGHIVASLSGGWGTVAYSTNVFGGLWVIEGPMSMLNANQKTNLASIVGAMVNDSGNTNPVIVLGANVVGAVSQATHATNADLAISVSTTNSPSTNALALLKTSGTQNYWSFDGSSETNLNATELRSGTVADARLGANVPLLNAQNNFSGSNYSATVSADKFFVTMAAMPGNLTLTAGGGYQTNLTANVTLAKFIGVPSINQFWSIYVWATNNSGGDKTITMPSGVRGQPGQALPAVYYVTNNACAELQVNGWGQNVTNANISPH